MRLATVGLVIVVLAASGCGITDGAKSANSQNGHIGELVEIKGRDLNDPELAQMGKDAKANADTVGREIGVPEVDLPYTPENSAAARKNAEDALRAREEGKTALWQVATAVAGFLGVGSIVGWFRAALASSKLSTFASVATSVVEAAPDLKKKFAEKAKDKGVAGVVDKVVQDHT
jgi:hypothetical protein